MPRKRHKPEEIVTKLRQVDVLVSQGQGIADAIRQIGVSEVTYYRWRQEFGGLKTEQVKRLKDLETENSHSHTGAPGLYCFANIQSFHIAIAGRENLHHISASNEPKKPTRSQFNLRICG